MERSVWTVPFWSCRRNSGTLSPTFGPVGTVAYETNATSAIPSPYADSLDCLNLDTFRYNIHQAARIIPAPPKSRLDGSAPFRITSDVSDPKRGGGSGRFMPETVKIRLWGRPDLARVLDAASR